MLKGWRTRYLFAEGFPGVALSGSSMHMPSTYCQKVCSDLSEFARQVNGSTKRCQNLYPGLIIWTAVKKTIVGMREQGA